MGFCSQTSGRDLIAEHPALCSSRISSAMLVRDSFTSSANGAFGRHERHDSAGTRLVTAASRWRSSLRRSSACVVRQAGQRTHKNQ